MRVNGYSVVCFEVETHITAMGKFGIGQGAETGRYLTYDDAVLAMSKAVGRGLGATCVARNAKGQGKTLLLGLVRP